MRGLRGGTVALLLVVVWTWGSLAAQLAFPTLTGRVVDGAGLLSAQQERELDGLLAAHEKATTEQVVVATVRSLQGVTIEEFGVALGRHWGIGQKDKDNGAILLVAPVERKVRIEVGYGLEGRLTDAVTHGIIQKIILPRFRAKDMQGGVMAGARAIVGVLEGDPPPAAEAPGGIKGFIDRTLLRIDGRVVFFVVFLAIIVLGRFLPPGGGGGVGRIGHGGISGSGGFSGGGFSGGGGGFGGGGSSGGW